MLYVYPVHLLYLRTGQVRVELAQQGFRTLRDFIQIIVAFL